MLNCPAEVGLFRTASESVPLGEISNHVRTPRSADGIGFHTRSGGLQILVEVRCNNCADPVIVWSESRARSAGRRRRRGNGGRRAWRRWWRRRGDSGRGRRAGTAGASWKTLIVPIIEFLTMPSAHANGGSDEIKASALNKHVVLATCIYVCMYKSRDSYM